MTLEERLATLETKTLEILDVLEQVARDADLLGTNIMRVLKGLQPEKAKSESQETRQWTWNPDKIAWHQAQGSSGPYERSEDVNSLEFKAMLKDLAEHKGKLNRDGRFYWVFNNGVTVGRTIPK